MIILPKLLLSSQLDNYWDKMYYTKILNFFDLTDWKVLGKIFFEAKSLYIFCYGWHEDMFVL